MRLAKGAKPGGGGCGRQFPVGANFAVEYKFGVGEFGRIAPVFRLAYLDTDGGASRRRTVCGRAPTCAAEYARAVGVAEKYRAKKTPRSHGSFAALTIITDYFISKFSPLRFLPPHEPQHPQPQPQPPLPAPFLSFLEKRNISQHAASIAIRIIIAFSITAFLSLRVLRLCQAACRSGMRQTSPRRLLKIASPPRIRARATSLIRA